ncbi:hypothetical protein [Peptoniphilus indolicus]|uniref:Uncharacterized protein n=2 Tax=Peptoniphilus indolicus TaxID=33030 RepID=G4D6F3_9FIRM|nr:hypothetical protein [Peptoniphilus indolicus]EGY76594.1 hypothetical protein HMPREF9129_1983 [Peptoniphilus indolicus ATCC 29427]SUB76286.1 Uncharacterised protein [Peptoniphilus indolicus]
MKRTAILITALCFIFLRCGKSFNPFVKVSISDKNGADQYLEVDKYGKNRKINEFKADNSKIYNLDTVESFLPEIVDNKVKNILKDIVITNENGERVKDNDILNAIIKKVAEDIEHNIIKCKIMEDENEYFVFVALNVNWVDPCYLYYYNKDIGELLEIMERNNVEVNYIELLQKYINF